MEFRVKDLLVTTLTARGGDTDPFCVTPTGILCCCIGWTANGTTGKMGSGLTESHLEALRGEIRAASPKEGQAPAEPADDEQLAALETKLGEALDMVRAQRQANKA